VDDCFECGTSIDIGGDTQFLIIGACNATDTGTTGVIWEYTTQATALNGAYIAFRTDAGNYHPFAVCGDTVSYAGSYLSGAHDGTDGLLTSQQDRGAGTQLLQTNADWDGTPHDTANGVGTASGSYAAGQSSWIGARNNGASLPFGGRLRSLLVKKGAVNVDQTATVKKAMRWQARIL
jgi:hypothetical protein